MVQIAVIKGGTNWNASRSQIVNVRIVLIAPVNLEILLRVGHV